MDELGAFSYGAYIGYINPAILGLWVQDVAQHPAIYLSTPMPSSWIPIPHPFTIVDGTRSNIPVMEWLLLTWEVTGSSRPACKRSQYEQPHLAATELPSRFEGSWRT